MFVFVAALVACSSGDKDPTAFTGGNFDFMTTGVTDGCSDGAFELIFMPEGTDEEWAYPVELPAWADLPQTYTIQLQDPYAETEVTVEAGEDEGELMVTGVEKTNLELQDYPGCFVDNQIDVELTIVTNDEVEGFATLHTSSLDEDTCPTNTSGAEQCDVVLDVMATREGMAMDM